MRFFYRETNSMHPFCYKRFPGAGSCGITDSMVSVQ